MPLRFFVFFFDETWVVLEGPRGRIDLNLGAWFLPGVDDPRPTKTITMATTRLPRAEEHPGIGTQTLAENAVEGQDDKEMPMAEGVLMTPTPGRLFYGCSYMFHLSGENSRDRYIKGSC